MPNVSKHTPGSWTASPGRGQMPSDWFDAVVVGPDGVFDNIAICPERRVYGPDGNGDDDLSREQVEANARLIAAAPELLDALRAMLGVHDFGGRRRCWCGDTGACAPCKARAAVAKAQGEADRG